MCVECRASLVAAYSLCDVATELLSHTKDPCDLEFAQAIRKLAEHAIRRVVENSSVHPAHLGERLHRDAVGMLNKLGNILHQGGNSNGKVSSAG